MNEHSYGSWPSAIRASDVAAGSTRLGSVQLDGEDTYWLEGRPEESGRVALMRSDARGRTWRVSPEGSSVRTRVHEYGGGSYTVRQGVIVFSEYADQRLYRLETGRQDAPAALTPPGPWRYAAPHIHPSGAWLVCVREDHSASGHEPANTLVRVALDGSDADGVVVATGHDFYASPRFNPDGRRLTWLAWSHPLMPWDGTELWVGDVAADGRVSAARRLAGGPAESIFQPDWVSPDTLVFISDRTGWWNPYRVTLDGPGAGVDAGGARDLRALCPMEAEFGLPLWQFDAATWAHIPGALIAARRAGGRATLVRIDLETGAVTSVAEDLTPGTTMASYGSHVALVVKSTTRPDAIVRFDAAAEGAAVTRRTAGTPPGDPARLSTPVPITFPTMDGATAHAWFHAPSGIGGPGERPPLIVLGHGGPTGAASPDLSLGLQFWTTRGFAVVDVDYRGSTGYGRAYREHLNGRWGEVDVEDCVAAVRHLISAGLVDAGRVVIRGSSAGGFTTLRALTTYPQVFAAGASYYGVSDLEVLARDTHKFEARYLDSLIGCYPDARDVYVARSPIHAVDRLSCPLILFQGLDDRVVPPAQSRTMADAVRARGLPVAYLPFPGEQHGFRQPATIARCLEAELAFYAAVLGFAPADTLPSLQIDNLETWRR